MRKAVTAVAALTFVAGIAGAQMKPKPSPTPTPAPRAGASPLSVQGAQQQGNTDSVRRIDRDEALKLFRKGEAVLVDVRSNQQFSLGHINGAVNIPGSQLVSRIAELPPKKLIITYCA